MTPQRRLYEYRLNNNLCPRCGNPMDREGACCQKCLDAKNEYVRKSREFFRKLNLCPRCGKVRLGPDEKTCPECRAKAAQNKRVQRQRVSEDVREQHNAYNRNLYQERVEAGLCVRCGKRKAIKGFRWCAICRNKDLDGKRIRYKRKIPDRKAEGICYRCGNPIEDTRHKLCMKCVEQNRINQERTAR